MKPTLLITAGLLALAAARSFTEPPTPRLRTHRPGPGPGHTGTFQPSQDSMAWRTNNGWKYSVLV